LENRGRALATINLTKNKILLARLSEIKGTVRLREPLWNKTSFRIGGPAEIFIQPQDISDLQTVLYFCSGEEIPVSILGNGTNLLIRDGGIRGVVISLKDSFNRLRFLGVNKGIVNIQVGAGLGLPQLLYRCIEEGWKGLEFAAGLPGGVGGAVVMNAGLKDKGVGELIEEVIIMDKAGQVEHLSRSELQFSYRKSNIPPDYIILGVKMLLEIGNQSEIKQEIERYYQKRKVTQPLNSYSAGCIFKNPPGDSAGRIIDSLGLKGFTIGKAQISPIHANFIVNQGGATATQIIELMEYVRSKVLEELGLDLEPEIQIWGKDVREKEE
jgi:UDP-N-acetylmuramate dehydrogenase